MYTCFNDLLYDSCKNGDYIIVINLLQNGVKQEDRSEEAADDTQLHENGDVTQDTQPECDFEQTNNDVIQEDDVAVPVENAEKDIGDLTINDHDVTTNNNDATASQEDSQAV